MPDKTIFTITRRDNDRVVDKVSINKPELKIGRHSDNDLILNDPAVARLQAIISKQKGRFWIVDILDAYATLLNGTRLEGAPFEGDEVVQVESAPLEDGDVVQIGPYFLIINTLSNELTVRVERESKVSPSKVLVPLAGRKLSPRPLSERLAEIDVDDRRELDTLWAERRRELGKQNTPTVLAPKTLRQRGKASLDWQSTLDLRPTQRLYHLLRAGLLLLLIAVGAGLIWKNIYSPAPLSAWHTSSATPTRGTALRPASNACSNCHQALGPMQQQCVDCHNVTHASASLANGFDDCHDVIHDSASLVNGFDVTISAAHQAAQVACTDCHTEHMGADFRPGAFDNTACVNCHNDQYNYKGGTLGTPHKDASGAPTTGYIKVNDHYKWKKLCEEKVWVEFHTRHPYADQGRLNRKDDTCIYCHVGQPHSEQWKRAAEHSCQACHSVSIVGGVITPTAPNCITCHRQHTLITPLKAAVENLSHQQRSDITAKAETQGAGGLGEILERVIPTTIGGGGPQWPGKRPATWRDTILSLAPAWYVWTGLGVVIVIALVSIRQARRPPPAKGSGKASAATVKQEKPATRAVPVEEEKNAATTTATATPTKAAMQGPDYAHPRIDADLCIGCYACIRACPQDVLVMSLDEIAAPAAFDQCMDDTACQKVCPTDACVVINSQNPPPKKINPDRKELTFETRNNGLYIVGDVSRVPLIGNAISEGAAVIESLRADIGEEDANDARAGAEPVEAEYDVAIIGLGPAGVSAAIAAHEQDLPCVAIEQRKVFATIHGYPDGKSVNIKSNKKSAQKSAEEPSEPPSFASFEEGVNARSTAGKSSPPPPPKEPLLLAIHGRPNLVKDWVLEQWEALFTAVRSNRNRLLVCEQETCEKVQKQGKVFEVSTRRNDNNQCQTYRVRRVVLAMGGNSRPKKMDILTNCQHCGTARGAKAEVCSKCRKPFLGATELAWLEGKVKYQAVDLAPYAGKKCVVVGGGNSAVETALALVGYPRDLNFDPDEFKPKAEVTLLVRSSFTTDLQLNNKMKLRDCTDWGFIKVVSRNEIIIVKDHEVILRNEVVFAAGEKKTKRLPNDYIFACIGGEWPQDFLLAAEVIQKPPPPAPLGASRWQRIAGRLYRTGRHFQ